MPMMTRALFPSFRYLKAIFAVYVAVAVMGAYGIVVASLAFIAFRQGDNLIALMVLCTCDPLWALSSRRGRHRILGWFPGGDLNALREEHRAPARPR